MTRSSKNVFWKTVAALLAAVMVLALVPAAMLRPVAELASEVPVLNETVVGTVRFQSFNFLGKNASGDDGVDYSATFYYTDDYFAHSAVNDAATAQKMPWTALDDVTLAACGVEVAMALDAADLISQSYMLEVGSAGLERALVKEEHFEICQGEEVRVHFIRNIDGEKEVIGTLVSADRENVTVNDGESDRAFALADISFVKLNFEFE